MRRTRILLSAIFFLLLFLLGSAGQGNTVHVSAEVKDNTICNGVFIDKVEVSGMTRKQAETAVESYIESLKNKGVAITVGQNNVITTLGDLGFEYEPNNNIDMALALGKSGNLIKRYKDLKDIEQGSIIYPLSFTFSENRIRELVSLDVSSYNIAPTNATVTRKNGEFIYTDHVVGSKVNIELTTALLADTIRNWNREDIIVAAIMEEDVPIYTRDVVELCNTLLGTFTTDFKSSAEGRAANLANGARLINNAVIYPGEVFSSYEYLAPFTASNGYYVAGAYLQGKVIDSVGGGACQVTTTLYNAVLNSELEIVERQPHSMTISYVDLSRDAAIAENYKDFKFKNNTDVPILVEATTKGRTITFKMWGNETRDTSHRKIEYETKILSTTKPPKDVVTEDPTQPTTYKKVTQSAHTGYKTELYKVVYEDGVEISRTLINTSSYSAAPRYITVGTKAVEEEPMEAESTKETGMDNLANPEDQLQADIWDPSWDEDEYEDE